MHVVPDTTAEVSPYSKSLEYDGVTAGMGSPYVTIGEDAVTTMPFLVMEAVPAA